MYQPPVVFQPQIGLTFLAPEMALPAAKFLPSAGPGRKLAAKFSNFGHWA